MTETIPLSQRPIDIVLVAFFLINLFFVSYKSIPSPDLQQSDKPAR